MDKKQVKTALAVCVVLFAAALLLATIFPQGGKGHVGDLEGSPVILNEILSSNRTYPTAEGRHLDFVEVRNCSDSPVDLSGYMLGDAPDFIGYTFPRGTVLPAGGCVVCWCDKDSDSDRYGSFGISKDGTDTIYLYNSANVLVDEIAVPRLNTNIPYVRQSDGSWSVGTVATPGYPNTDEGYEAWLKANGGNDLQVVISEIMTSNDCLVVGEKRISDWVELENVGKTVSLDGCYLTDDPADPMKWRLPALTLEAGERLVIPCVGSGAGGTEADFALPAAGCTVVLTGPMGNTLSKVAVPAMAAGKTWALRADGAYEETRTATPGYANDPEGYDAWLRSVGGDVQVVISEILSSNGSTVTDHAGRLCDWVELENRGDAAVVLDGAYLSDDPAERDRWQIDRLTLDPGQRTVICCVGENAAAGEADFALPRSGCTMTLTGAAGNLICEVECPRLDRDRSWALQADGTYAVTAMPTPGYTNDDAGRLAWLASQKPAGPLVISEVMPSNTAYFRQSDGKYYDWVELVNRGPAPIDLSDYCLSDDADVPDLFRLPQQMLEPGERIVVICSGSAVLSGSDIRAPFTLSREESWLYLTGPDGGFSDYLRIYDVPYLGSVGREEGGTSVGYFTTPTPGTPNGTGVALISGTPLVLTPGGVFENVKTVPVELEGPGEIRYTLDGSKPTDQSPVYAGPISLTATTVVRAACFEAGKLPGDVVTASYILNEGHTLPVLSLTTEPDDLFGYSGLYKNYTSEREVPCNLTLFEDDGGFSIDCGLKMHGHTGLQAPKKSFKVNFRGRYGQDVLCYPVYGADGPEVYDSLCIRAGQDYPLAIIRDELFTSLCRDMGDAVLAQRYKFCVLYINGEYFGIYSLKEAFSETFYAENRGVSADSVTMVQAPVGTADDMYEIFNYCMSHDMSQPEHYDYVASRVNIESLIDWIIIEGYCCNSDVQQNLRYFRSTETGNRWEFAFYDLDWTFYVANPFRHVLGDATWQHMPLTRSMMKNLRFREQFFARLSEVMDTTLSDEAVLGRIDELVELLDPEVPRERQRWGSDYDGWQAQIQKLRSFVQNGHLREMVTRLQEYCGLTAQEAETWFGRWIG